MNLIIIILINIKNANKSWHFNILMHDEYKVSEFESKKSFFQHLSFLRTGLEIIKLCLCSTQLNMKFIMLINVQMPIIVGFLIFISMKNKYNMSEFESKKSFFQHFSF